MIVLNRIRILIFALMIFGAFASFARNVWGNQIVVLCQVALAISFLSEMGISCWQRVMAGDRKSQNAAQGIDFLILFSTWTYIVFLGGENLPDSLLLGLLFSVMFSVPLFVLLEFIIALVKKSDKSNIAPVLENYLILLGFLGAIFRNMFWPGASMLSVFGLLGLSVFYFFSVISFFRRNFKSGKRIVLLLSMCFLAAVIIGLSILFRIQHWPGGQAMQYLGIGLTFFVLVISIRRKFTFNGAPINVVVGLRMQKNHFLLMYTVAFVFCGYMALKQAGIAPDFYSQYYPAATYKLRSEKEQSEIKDVYQRFVANCRNNNFVK